jgi:hypothetical protein
MGLFRSAGKVFFLLFAVLQLQACTAPVPAPGVRQQAESAADAGTGFEGWSHRTLPGKRPTRYQVTQLEGRWVVKADADASVSLFRRNLRVETVDLGSIEFAWRVPELMAKADLTKRATADSPVRVVLAFDGDRSKLSQKNRLVFDLAESLTGEQPPYASLMYVWDTHVALETVIPGASSDRIRKVVVDSGTSQLKSWRIHTRQIAQDYRRAFGEEPGPLIGVAFMTDSDNTRSHAQAWYGAVRLLGRDGTAQ